MPRAAMNDTQRKLVCLCLVRRRRKKRNRRFWVHPILERRNECGVFSNLFDELRNDETKFFNYFRMSVASFDELHGLLKNCLQRENTKMRNCIQPLEMLAVTVRYLASGCTFTDLHYNFRLGVSTISNIVKEVCNAIWRVVRKDCFPPLTKEKLEEIAVEFERKANFPHCIGAVDGKHIRVVKPENSGSMFFNYKGYFSIVILAVSDANYCFTYVDIGSYGAECDPTIFSQSSLWTSIETGVTELPEARPLNGTLSPNIPYFFLGDDAFPQSTRLLKPYGGHGLNITKKVFNYRLSRARRYVECSFGILSNKWRIFHRPLNVDVDLAVSIVKACVVLHNYVRDRDGYKDEDFLTIQGLSDVRTIVNPPRSGIPSNKLKNVMADYFMTEAGSLSWQLQSV